MTAKKKITIRIPEGVDIEKFLDEIISSVSSQEAFYKIRGNILELKIVGDPISIERSVDTIRRLASLYLPSSAKKKITVVNLSNSARTLGFPVPIEPFTRLLEILDIKVERKDEELVIHENIERVREIASNFFEKLKSSRALASGKAAELVALLSTVFEIFPDEVLEVGEKIGALRENEGKAVLVVGWDNALHAIMDVLTKKEQTDVRSIE